MVTDGSVRAPIERVLARPVADAKRAVWGFTNRTDIVTLAAGDRVVVQRYRRREDAECRLRVMRALWAPAAEAGIAIPRIRESDLAADPPWVIFEALPGVPIPEAGDAGLEGRGSRRSPGRWASCSPPSAGCRSLGSSLTTCGPIPAASPLARPVG